MYSMGVNLLSWQQKIDSKFRKVSPMMSCRCNTEIYQISVKKKILKVNSFILCQCKGCKHCRKKLLLYCNIFIYSHSSAMMAAFISCMCTPTREHFIADNIYVSL